MPRNWRAALANLITLLFASTAVLAQENRDYTHFDNIFTDNDAPTATSITQDNLGVLWIGTIKGLYSYNGYTAQPHHSSSLGTDVQIHCSLTDQKSLLYLGTDKGVFRYSYKHDRYLKPINTGSSVRALLLDGTTLWIGTLNGLYQYDISTETLKQIDKQSWKLTNQTIYALLKLKDKLFIGTYNGLYIYQNEKSIAKVALPQTTGKSNLFVNSLVHDSRNGIVWVGTEGSLFRYNLNDGKSARIAQLEHNSVKSLAIDPSSNLLVGTDNGLYILNSKGAWSHIVHDSRITSSLSNNIVWTIYVDKDKNCWFGTEYGISLNKLSNTYSYNPISKISGTGEGNRISTIYKDSRGELWLGGTNGLLKVGPQKPTVWFKMDNPSYPISHNRVRKIYETKDGTIWAATDGSINRYDSQTGKLHSYTIIDSSRTRNANWCYDLFEDGKGRVWIATFLGGLFIVDKEQLEQNSSTILAKVNLTTKNGLSENYLSQIVPDHNGNVWVLFRNREVNQISVNTLKVGKFTPKGIPNNERPTYLFCDSDGIVWIGFKGGVARLKPNEKEVQSVIFDRFNPYEVLAITQEGGRLWIATSSGIWTIGRKNLRVEQYLSNSIYHFASIYHDQQSHKIYLGGVDGFATTTTKQQKARTERPVVLTSLLVNNRPYVTPEDGSSIRYSSRITLKHNQNNLTFEFSDLAFSIDEKPTFMYKLVGASDEWNQIGENNNRISFSNLSPGSYTLQLSKLSNTGVPTQITEVIVKILPPWYLTIAAKLVYLLLLAGAAAWVINFYNVKNRLKMEREDKKRMLELSKMKVDFFTDISHELKTPLSLIIAPLSKLILEIKEGDLKGQLKRIHSNAMKLNALIHQALEFERLDNKASSQLILSKVDIVELSRSLLAVFQESNKDKSIDFEFESSTESLYMDMDIIKMESVLNNLIFNAIKYTPEGGKIQLTLAHNPSNKKVTLTVKDTGTGIAPEHLPHIFQRFFQANGQEEKQQGSGIGLYLVKAYVEQHGGTVSVTSKPNEGTTFTLTIPIKEQPTNVEQAKASTPANAPDILIVEDNIELSEVICSSLGTGFRYRKASNGKAALAMVAEKVPDLIITDVMMPVMSGLEMCRKLRKSMPTSTIPIIILTAKEAQDVEKEATLLNIDAVITKPFEPEMLQLKVEHIIAKSKLLEEKVRLESLSTPKNVEATSVNEKFLSVIISIVEANISNPEFNVNELSHLSGYGAKQLYRKVKQLTGDSPVDFIKSIRMKKAAMLLNQKKFTVAEVMYMVGFSNHSYFSKCFQAYFNKTPRQYLEENV